MFASLEESLREWTTCTVGSLDRPDTLRPRLGVVAHRGVPGPVGGEAT